MRAIAEAQQLLAGPAIQARCLECPAATPRAGSRRRRVDRLRLLWLWLAAVKLRARRADDAAAIAAIYAPYVEASIVSFETEAPDEAEMRAGSRRGGDLYPWLAAVDEAGTLAGYAYASAFRPRPAYRFTVETTVYVADGAPPPRRRQPALPAAARRCSRRRASPRRSARSPSPIPASVALHERLGFARAGTYTKVGWKQDGWWDVGLWQRALAPATMPPAEPRPWREVGFADPLLVLAEPSLVIPAESWDPSGRRTTEPSPHTGAPASAGATCIRLRR